MNGERYDVLVQLAAEDRASPSTLSTIFIRSPRGEMGQLSNIVSVRESVAPKKLKRFNQLRAVTILANLAPGYALGDGLAFLEQTARELLPNTVQTDFSGQAARVPCLRAEPRPRLRARPIVYLPRPGSAV